MALFLALMAPNPEITEQHCNIVACAGLKSNNPVIEHECVSWAEREMDAAATGSDIFSHKTLTSWFLPTPMNLWQITFDPKSPPAPSLAGLTKISGCLVQHIEIQARSQKHLIQSSNLSLQMFSSIRLNQCWVFQDHSRLLCSISGQSSVATGYLTANCSELRRKWN